MSNTKLPLGQAVRGMAKLAEPTIEQRIEALERRLYEMEIRFRRATIESERTKSKVSRIPEDVLLIGRTKGQQYVLRPTPEGFKVGDYVYKSLSAAAEAVSGVRRSGWTFWHLPDGRTAKEVFGKK